MSKPFTADQFTSTEYDSAKEKAKWANAMVNFIEKGFREQDFTKRVYDGLYIHLYDHIAHYNQWGFYSEWFSTDRKRLEWFLYALDNVPHGSPRNWLWDDVEIAFAGWIRESGLIEEYSERIAKATEERERALLAQLKVKYEQAG